MIKASVAVLVNNYMVSAVATNVLVRAVIQSSMGSGCWHFSIEESVYTVHRVSIYS